MLEHTFAHIPGIGERMERVLWQEGCLTWDDLLGGLDRYSVGTAEAGVVRKVLEESRERLVAKDHRFFARELGLREAWRAWAEFRDRCVYLDIETDGGNSGDSITTIGMWDGREFQVLVKGRDLEDFPDVIGQYGLIVTFFGAGFDIPMLQRRFREVRFDQIHLDLCPTLRRIGLRGGLKKIERQLGISRSEDTDGLGGLDAIRLWRRYRLLRDEQALETLIAYNREDVVNLEWLADYAYKRLRRDSFGSATNPATPHGPA